MDVSFFVVIPTYYGISIAIPRYIAMQLSTIPFITTCSIIIILLELIPLHHVILLNGLLCYL